MGQLKEDIWLLFAIGTSTRCLLLACVVLLLYIMYHEFPDLTFFCNSLNFFVDIGASLYLNPWPWQAYTLGVCPTTPVSYRLLLCQDRVKSLIGGIVSASL